MKSNPSTTNFCYQKNIKHKNTNKLDYGITKRLLEKYSHKPKLHSIKHIDVYTKQKRVA